MLSVREPIRRRQLIERPLDIIGLELLVTISQALLAGILLSLAAQLGGDARAYGLPLPGLLAVLAIVVGAGWLRWLVGGSGWLMASVGAATAILTGALWLLALQDASLPRVDWLVGLLAATCAIYGLVAGVFLDGPHRAHWKGGVSQPRRGVSDTRATPARFSPPVQKVVDERLTNVHLPQVSMPSTARLKAVGIPRPSRPPAAPSEQAADGLSVAEAVAPHMPSVTEVEVASEVQPALAPGPSVATQPAPVPDPTPEPEPVPEAVSVAEPEPVPEPVPAPTEGVAEAEPEAREVDPDATRTDPDAPTQPVARSATEWPRPIEPHGPRARPPQEDDATSS